MPGTSRFVPLRSNRFAEKAAKICLTSVVLRRAFTPGQGQKKIGQALILKDLPDSLAAELGFEPRQTESESVVLPLHNSANRSTLYIIHRYEQMSIPFYKFFCAGVCAVNRYDPKRFTLG